MTDYKIEFIEFLIHHNVLKFGEFTLKSGRVSPYFFNAGEFKTGLALAQLGQFYAQAIVSSGLEFDLLFGPAYKGIPLVAAVAIALAEKHGIDKPYAFNRKEAKNHGEGGLIVGQALRGRILLVDDVISAGTAFRESHQLITAAGADVVGIAICMDRQEKGQAETSAVQEVEAHFGAQVVSIITLSDLIKSLKASGRSKECAAIEAYQEQYGI